MSHPDSSVSKGATSPTADNFGEWVKGLAEREANLRAQIKAAYQDDDLERRRASLAAIHAELGRLYEEGSRPVREDLERLGCLERNKWGRLLTDVPSFK